MENLERLLPACCPCVTRVLVPVGFTNRRHLAWGQGLPGITFLRCEAVGAKRKQPPPRRWGVIIMNDVLRVWIYWEIKLMRVDSMNSSLGIITA